MSDQYNESVASHYSAYRPPLHQLILQRAELGTATFPIGLDVGCGTGRSSVALADFCEQVFAIDPSQPMLDAATPHHCDHLPKRIGRKDSCPGSIHRHRDLRRIATLRGLAQNSARTMPGLPIGFVGSTVRFRGVDRRPARAPWNSGTHHRSPLQPRKPTSLASRLSRNCTFNVIESSLSHHQPTWPTYC